MERLPLKSEVIKDTAKEVPPYTGFGSEEDSLTSSQGLEPRAPQPDFFKFMHKDRSNFLLLTYLLEVNASARTKWRPKCLGDLMAT